MIYKFYQKRIFPHLLNQVMQTSSFMKSRQELLSSIEGNVLEIGFGTGINLEFYKNINQLYALEPNAEIFHLAAERISNVAFKVQHIQASAEKMPFADNSIDNIVSTWTMCSIADLDQALTEIYRVLKPSGTLHLVEHVAYNDQPRMKQIQDLLTPIQKVIADGCHLNRNIEQALQNAHFQCAEKHYFDAEKMVVIAKRMFMARAQKI